MDEPIFNISGIGLENGVLADVLKLEVETDPEGLKNLVANPDGFLGGYAWVSPVTGTKVDGATTHGGVSCLQFYTSSGSVATRFTTELLPATAGEYIAARWEEQGFEGGGNTGYYRVRFEFVNAAGAVVSSSTQSGYYLNDFAVLGTVRTYAAVVIPAGATRARLRFDLYSNTSAANPTASRRYRFTEVVVATAATSGELATLDYEPVPYIDVLGPTHKISVNRAGLEVGTLSAEILDASIDPADAPLIRPGRRVVLSSRYPTSGEWVVIYTGTLLSAKVQYHLDDDTLPDSKRARVVINAVDAVATLAAALRTESVATVDELPYVLEGAGVPWWINGLIGQQVTTATVRAVADNTTAIDQVAITRDTAHGFAWVDRNGWLQAWDPDEIFPFPWLVEQDETWYTDAVIGYDTDDLINEVGVTVRSKDATGQTVETVSTYTDAASIAKWGRKRAEFTVLAPTNAATFAAEVLAANAAPAVRISSVTYSIRDNQSLIFALLDLYDMVTLQNVDKGISHDSRITAISHEIDSGVWLMDVEFATPGAVAAPQLVPPLSTTATITEARGTELMSVAAANTFYTQTITFATPMAQTPTILLTPISSGGTCRAYVSARSTSGFTIAFARDTATNTNVMWHATCKP